MVPSAGSNFTYHQFLSFEPGESGIDAQWDFSNLGPTDAYTINYIAAETSPHAEVFGNADIALTGSGTYEYYEANEELFSKVGVYTQNILIDFVDGQDVLRFPFTYGTEYIDPFEAHYQSDGINVTMLGTVEVSADAYGELNLPYGKVTDVIRVSYIANYSEVYELNGEIDSVIYYSEAYVWYKNDLSQLATINHLEINGSSYEFGAYLDQSHVGLDDELSKVMEFNLFPNPAEDYTNIEFTLQESQEVELSMYSILGEKIDCIKKGNLNPGVHKLSLDLNKYNSGIYLLKVEFDGKQICRSIRIQ